MLFHNQLHLNSDLFRITTTNQFIFPNPFETLTLLTRNYIRITLLLISPTRSCRVKDINELKKNTNNFLQLHIFVIVIIYCTITFNFS